MGEKWRKMLHKQNGKWKVVFQSDDKFFVKFDNNRPKAAFWGHSEISKQISRS